MLTRRVLMCFIVTAATLLFMLISQLLPRYSHHYRRTFAQTPFPNNMAFTARLQRTLKQKLTVMEMTRTLLSMLIPLLGVMVSKSSGWTGSLCLVRKLLVLEGRLWREWCPESYILFLSVGTIILYARRFVFIHRYKRHDRLKKKSYAAFMQPSPAYNYGLA